MYVADSALHADAADAPEGLDEGIGGGGGEGGWGRVGGRGLHSSTFQPKFNALHGIGVAVGVV